MKDTGKREQFARLLLEIGHAVTRIEREQVCCGELTFQQFDTLRRIDRDGTDTVGVISAALGIDDSTASRNVAILVRDGYLKKTRDPSDGRALRLALTSKGRSVLSNLSCEEREVFSAVYERFSPTERVGILAVLSSVQLALEQDRMECCAPGEPDLRTKTAR